MLCEKAYSVMQRGLVLGPYTLDRQHCSTRQQLFHWTRSVTIEQPPPHSGLLQDVGCHPVSSLTFNVNELK